jgi:hypothetical protein
MLFSGFICEKTRSPVLGLEKGSRANKAENSIYSMPYCSLKHVLQGIFFGICSF